MKTKKIELTQKVFMATAVTEILTISPSAMTTKIEVIRWDAYGQSDNDIYTWSVFLDFVNEHIEIRHNAESDKEYYLMWEEMGVGNNGLDINQLYYLAEKHDFTIERNPYTQDECGCPKCRKSRQQHN